MGDWLHFNWAQPRLKLACVYLITCHGNSRVYVGSTGNYHQRKIDHLKHLRKGSHPNPKMQGSWDKYGEDSFEFTVLIACDEEDLLRLEQGWLDRLDACKRGMNIAKFVTSGFRGRTWSKEGRAKIGANRKGKCVGAENYMWGKNQPEERKKHQSLVMSGRYDGDKNPYFGKKHSEETREKMRAAHARSGRMKGENNINFKNKARMAAGCAFLFFLAPILNAQLLSLPPKPTLSKAGENLILDFEIGDHTGVYYNRFLRNPEWPGASSGITWGAGYDGGQTSSSVIRSDWAKHPDVDRLSTTSGIIGQRAHSILPKYKDIETPYNYALEVFNTVDVARFWAQTRKAFPGFDSLRPNAQASLCSIIFNRGSSMAGESRREMRALRDLVPKRDYYAMAYQIRQMKRLWPLSTDAGAGLQRRREAEAVLMETP